jgi:hypothetical protein
MTAAHAFCLLGAHGRPADTGKRTLGHRTKLARPFPKSLPPRAGCSPLPHRRGGAAGSCRRAWRLACVNLRCVRRLFRFGHCDIVAGDIQTVVTDFVCAGGGGEPATLFRQRAIMRTLGRVGHGTYPLLRNHERLKTRSTVAAHQECVGPFLNFPGATNLSRRMAPVSRWPAAPRRRGRVLRHAPEKPRPCVVACPAL